MYEVDAVPGPLNRNRTRARARFHPNPSASRAEKLPPTYTLVTGLGAAPTFIRKEPAGRLLLASLEFGPFCRGKRVSRGHEYARTGLEAQGSLPKVERVVVGNAVEDAGEDVDPCRDAAASVS